MHGLMAESVINDHVIAIVPHHYCKGVVLSTRSLPIESEFDLPSH